MERGPTDGIDARTLHTVLGFAALAAIAFAARERGLSSLRARVSAPDVVMAARPPAPLGAPTPAHESTDERLDAILTAPPAPSRDAPVRGAIENVAALNGFYARLAAVEARTPRAMVRVAVYGDSVVADDKIPARIRARLQQRFGDGGPGFVLPSPPSRWYHHRDVTLAAQGFTGHTVVQDERPPDGLLGYAGMAFEARDGGATTTLTLAPRAVSPAALRVSWWYLQRPGGGSFERREGNGPPVTVRTDAPTSAPAGHTQVAPGGVRALTLATAPGSGPVRVYGAVLEREGPGVVVDNLGLVGSSAAALRRGDERFWQAHLARRGVDLVVFLLGANEAYRGSIDPERSQRTFEAMLATVRANPAIDCLVLAPLDEAMVEGDAVVTRPTIPLLVEAQHRAALAQRCAFWNTFAWMGGRGSASRWNRSAWMEPDLVHPTAAGAVRVADAVVDALLAARRGATP